jgi:hypothetical protein
MRAVPKKLGRRELGRSIAGVALARFAAGPLVTGCSNGTSRGLQSGTQAGPQSGDGGLQEANRRSIAPQVVRLRGEVEVWSCFDLPQGDPRSRELSGVTFDPSTRTFWAVQDELSSVVPLRPDARLERWELGEPIKLHVDGPLDLEGIAILDDGFIVASEIGPRLIEVDRQGRLRRERIPPPKFYEAVRNKSFESLTLDPAKKVLYTTSETALPRDHAATSNGTGPRVRILRSDLVTGEVVEHAYATDAVVTGGGDYGVSDLTALAVDDLLVLERGFRKGVGNEIRIYRVDLTDTASICHSIEQLRPDGAVLPKKLLVDLSKLPPKGASAPRQPQQTPLMENYEGLTVGPTLPDGRMSLVLVSDDNGRAVQTPRVLTLAVR